MPWTVVRCALAFMIGIMVMLATGRAYPADLALPKSHLPVLAPAVDPSIHYNDKLRPTKTHPVTRLDCGLGLGNSPKRCPGYYVFIR